MIAENINRDFSYFLERFERHGLTSLDAKKHGISVDNFGNILTFPRNYNGKYYNFIPKWGKKRDDYNKAYKRKNSYIPPSDISFYEERLHVLRYEPKRLEKLRKVTRKNIGKYKYQSAKYTGLGVVPMPTTLAIDNYKNGVTGGTVAFIEGYFKALVMSLYGIESTAYNGINSYKLTDGIKEYLLSRKPDTVVLCYDGDYKDIKRDNKTGEYNDSRLNQFVNSATKFSKSFYEFIENNELDTKLVLCVPNAKQECKGFDDLLENEPVQDVLHEFDNRIDGNYFEFLQLTKTTYKRKINSKYENSNVSEFYKDRATLLKDETFIFKGERYQRRHINHLLINNLYYCHILSNPFQIELNETELKVNRYISEVTKQLDEVIQSNDRLSIEMLTGGGKTSYFLGYNDKNKYHKGYFERTGNKGIIALPYTSNVEQLRQQNKNKKIGFLHGRMSPVQRAKAMQKDIIVCTYDQVKNIPVITLERSVLVIDESHNLVNQSSFRYEALRHLYECIGSAKKAILISGTPPRLLAKVCNLKCVRISQKQVNKVHISHVSTSIKTFNAKVLQMLEREDWNSDKIRFALCNNIESLEKIKQLLIDRGILKDSEIEVITSEKIRSNTSVTYGDILKYSKVRKGTKLVLCTCVLSEGVNINNENVGNIYLLQVNSIDLTRQFVARFRAVETINAISIRSNKNNVAKAFNVVSEYQYNSNLESAKYQRKTLQREYDSHNNERIKYLSEYAEHMEQCMQYFDESDNEQKKTTIFDFAYLDGATAKVDYLALLRAEKEREYKYMSNLYYYSRLSDCQNIEFLGDYQNDVQIDDKYNEIVKDFCKSEEEKREQVKTFLIEELKTNAPVVVAGLKAHYKRTKNKTLNSTLRQYQTTDIENVKGIEYMEQYKELYNQKWVRILIIYYIRFTCSPLDNILDILRTSTTTELHELWRHIQHLARVEVSASKRGRLEQSTEERLNTKFKVELSNHLDLLDKELNLSELLETVNNKLCSRRYQKYSKIKGGYVEEKERYIVFTKTKLLYILKEMYNVHVSSNNTVLCTKTVHNDMCQNWYSNHRSRIRKLLEISRM